jgi:hypothetical protein
MQTINERDCYVDRLEPLIKIRRLVVKTREKIETKNAKAEEAKTGEVKERFDHDGLWKDLIERFFHSMLKRALPELYEAADLTKKPRFLDKEFRDILNTADPVIHRSPHFADYLMETALKDGGEEWLLFHFEVQGKGGGSLATRMRHYNSFIYAHYKREPTALAIITDKRPAGEPEYYSHSRYGTEIVYRYNRLVLAELNDEELQASDEPFDMLLYAAKCAMRSKNELQKYTYLRTLTGRLSERGWDMQDKRDLMLYLERIMNLKDEALRLQYREYQESLDKEGKILYITVAEEFYTAKGMEKGIEKGMARGMEKGKEEMARKLLAKGFSPDVIAESADLPLDRIQSLLN